MRSQLDSRHAAVSEFITRATGSNLPEEFKAYLFRFGTVLICGNIERSLEIIILGRLNSRAHPRVLNFVKSYFQRGTNYNCAAIAQLLNRFDSDWYRGFETFVDANADIKEGVISCYEVRNSVAHGGTSGVGERRIKELLDISKRLIDGIVSVTV